MRWERVEALVERAPQLSDLQLHGLDLVAAQRLRARGAELPPALLAHVRVAAAIALAAPVLLRRARTAYDGRLLLFKGPEVAARYPDPAMRNYSDLDLLADDAPAAQRALLAAGFVRTGLWAPHIDVHHLQPLAWPGLPIAVELHAYPHVPAGLRPPPTRELLATAVPSCFAADVVETLAPAEHTLVVAAHAWAHDALANIGQLLDVALLASQTDRPTLRALAARWGWQRLWRATEATLEALFDDGRPPAAQRLCAPHLRAARERTLLERHVAELAGPAFGLPPRRAALESARVLRRRILPGPEETWRRKARRARRALRHRGLRHSEHDARLPSEDLQIGAIPGLERAPVPEPRGRP